MDYPGPVMIIHGTADELVPLSYSEKALAVFENASLVKIPGAGHGFYNDDEKRVARLAIEFVRKHTRQP
jgi:pimeloyl-ACP methyl ester carboxylesterase